MTSLMKSTLDYNLSVDVHSIGFYLRDLNLAC